MGKSLIHIDKVETLIDGIYEAAGNASRWQGVLEQAADLLGAESSQIGHLSLADQTFSFLITYGQTYSEERIRQYQSMMGEDPRLAALSRLPFRAMHCRMVLSDEELHGSQLYQDVLAPDGNEYTLGVNLVEEEKSTSFFTAHRDIHQPPFGPEECALLQDLVPHLRRAIRLYHGFAEMDLMQSATRQALDQVPLGVFIVRPDGHYVIGNRMAEQLAAAGSPMLISNGKVATTSTEVTRRLRMALTRVMSEPDAAPEALHLAAADGQPCRLLVAPLSEPVTGRTFVRHAGDLAVIYVNNPARSFDPPWERLQHMFGLFPSEAKLLARLAAGETVAEAGTALGLTAASARQYLKNVFSKTGTHSQSELLQVVMQSPAWMDPGTAIAKRE